MWRKKLRKLIPDHLQHLFSESDHDGENESRKFDFKAHVVEPSPFPVLIPKESEQEKEYHQYLSYWKSLSFREQEVLALVCLGHKNHEIAAELDVAHGTIKTHLQNIFRKFSLRDRHEIRLILRDWDFQMWWLHRHRTPTPTPRPSTRG